MALTKDKVVTVESLKALHDYDKKTYRLKTETIPVNKGGTGTSIDLTNAPNGAIIRRLKTDQYDQLYYTSTANGAFFATETDGVAKFGTLPIAQGGIGSNNGATGLKNLFAAGNTVLSSYQYGDTLPAAGTKGRIFFKKLSE